MNSGDRNVVSYSDIAGGVPPDLQVMLVVCVEDEEHFRFTEFLLLISRTQSFKNDKIFFGALDIDDVCDPVVDIDRKRKFLFTELAIYLFELDYYVALHCFHGLVSLQPSSETFQVNTTHCSGTIARRYHRVELLIIMIDYFIIIIKTNPTNHSRVIGHF